MTDISGKDPLKNPCITCWWWSGTLMSQMFADDGDEVNDIFFLTLSQRLSAKLEAHFGIKGFYVKWNDPPPARPQ